MENSAPIPCIVVGRHDPGVYEWGVYFADEKLDSDVGDTSITECLQSAIALLPLDVRHVEIRYRGVHMGTFKVEALAERPDLVADLISEGYSSLF